MKFIKKHTYLLISLAFALLYIGFWRIAVDTINTVRIEEREDEVKSKPEDIVPSDVILKAETASSTWEYNIRNYENLRMYSNDSLWDLIDKLRDMGELTYEQTEYVYGPRITQFNGINSTENLKWNFYADGELIEGDFDKVKLEDEVTYTLKLE